MTTLTAADGHKIDAYEAKPHVPSGGVVVIQEIFGVNDHIRSVVDRFAEEGYHSIAPALFDRVQHGIELDYDEDGVTRGRELRGRIDWDDSVSDVAAAVDYVAPAGRVAVVGFCYGGSVAWRSGAKLPIAAAVGYYGGQIHDQRNLAPATATMLHFGAEDQAIPLSDVEEVQAMYPQVAVHVYEGAGHGFHCDARDSYHPEAAALAWERTLDFLRNNGVG